jgi:putative ABC transport system permease protein
MAIQKLCVYQYHWPWRWHCCNGLGVPGLPVLFQFDKFHPDIDNVYRGLTYRQGGEGVYGVFPMAAVQSAKIDFFGVTEVTRVNKSIVNIKSPKDETFTEVVDFTNPSFFKLFNFPLIEGSNDLTDQSAVLITKKTAEKYFGRIDPIGKTLLFYAGESFAFPSP